MAHIKLADLTAEQSTVEMFGHTYIVLPVTRSVQKKLEAVDKNIEAIAGEEDGDKIVAALVGGLDALLKAQNGADPVKKLLMEAWKSDDLSLAQLRGLFEGVQASSVERPT